MSNRAKVLEYEHFIQNTLKADLKDISSQLERHSEDLKQWLQVKHTVKLLREYSNTPTSFTPTVYTKLFNDSQNLQVLAKSELKDVNTIYIKIGCNCLLEMNLTEADKYADIRINFVEKQLSHLREMAVKVKVNIKLVLLAINELDPLHNIDFDIKLN